MRPLALLIIRFATPRAHREFIFGDTLERAAEIERTQGAAAASRWLWREAWRVVVRAPYHCLVVRAAPGHPSGRATFFAWSFVDDARFAVRSLRKSPGVTFVVVLTLAVAIGANTAIFSVVEAVLLSPLPYPDQDRIVRVGASFSGSDSPGSFSDRGYWHFVDNSRSFEKFGAYRVQNGTMPLTGDGPPLLLEGTAMSLSAFEALGVSPEIGRLPTPEEDAPGGAIVALLSHELWVSRYGADPSVLGRTVNVLGFPAEVIGVMPAGYDFPTPDMDLWFPLALNPASQNWSGHNIRAIARLAPGVTTEAAAEDARSLIARFGEVGYARTWLEGVWSGGAIVRPLRDEIVGDMRPALLIVLGTAGFVLLVACSNVANLLLVRVDGRRQENAVRMALGAGRARLARQVLVESALLALAGGAAGMLLAHLGVRALVAIAPASIPRLDAIGIDGTALAVTALVALLAGLLLGSLPAIRSSSVRTLAALRDGGRSAAGSRTRHRARNLLVTSQVALAFVLVIGAGLMVRSFEALQSVDLGFSAEGVLTFEVRPLGTKYGDDRGVAQLYGRLIERLEAIPGVTRVGGINTLPLTDLGDGVTSLIEEFPPAEGEGLPVFMFRRTTPGYFEAMGVPVIEGRTFAATDGDQERLPMLISESLKARYWPDESALGKRILFGGRTPAEVVGVVGDVRDQRLEEPAEPRMYLPPARGAMTMTVRTTVDPLSVVAAIRSAIAELDGDLPMGKIQTLERVVGDSMSRTSFTASVLSIAALVALFLGSVGIYGVLSYVVSQRTAEIGIRTALGATPEVVRRMILSQGMWLVGIGVLLGLVAAVALGGLLGSQLYGVSPFDPVTILIAAAIFVAVAILASLRPAARAAGASPLDALRTG
jgi:putative ABC transport system permease protein